MSTQLPPLEDLPIFDSAVFTAGDQALTYNQALKRFLRYPAAQGKETLAEIVVNGPATFNSSLTVQDPTVGPFGDPIDVEILPNSIIVHNGNGSNQTTSITALSTIINNSDVGGITTIEPDSLSFNNTNTGTISQLNATQFVLQDGVDLSNTISMTSIVINSGNTGDVTTLTDNSLNINNFGTTGTETTLSGQSLIITNTPTGETVNVNPSQITLTDAVGTALSLTNETISNVANIQNLLSETTQYLDLRSGYDAPNNTFQSDIHLWKQNLSLSTNNTQNVVCLQDNGLFGGYTIPSQNWDFDAGTLPQSNWIFSPNGTFTQRNNNSGGFFTTHQVSNTSAYINTSAPQMELGTSSSTWLNIQSSSLNNNCPIPATSDSSTIIPTTNWVQNRFGTFLSNTNAFTALQNFTTISTTGMSMTGGTFTIAGPGNQQTRISQQTTPSACLDIYTNAGATQQNFFIRGGTTINGSAYGPANGTGTMVAFQLGQTAFQNYAGSSASQGFRFSSVTNVSTDKILGIIPYNTPATTDSGQNLGTTLWSQTTFAPTTITPITVSAGNLVVPLGAAPVNNFSCALTGNLTTMTVASAINNSRFTIYLTVGAGGLTLSKALSAQIVNNLGGDVALVNGSKWLFQGVTQSGPLTWLTITNMT